MKGNAVPGEIVGTLTNGGDPNLLLQVGMPARVRGCSLPCTARSVTPQRNQAQRIDKKRAVRTL